MDGLSLTSSPNNVFLQLTSPANLFLQLPAAAATAAATARPVPVPVSAPAALQSLPNFPADFHGLHQTNGLLSSIPSTQLTDNDDGLLDFDLGIFVPFDELHAGVDGLSAAPSSYTAAAAAAALPLPQYASPQMSEATVSAPAHVDSTWGFFKPPLYSTQHTLTAASAAIVPAMAVSTPNTAATASTSVDSLSSSTSTTTLSPVQTAAPLSDASTAATPIDGPPLDHNGRPPRKFTKRRYTCSHCEEVFHHTHIEDYAEHIDAAEAELGVAAVGRVFKCEIATCPWHRIGFTRKLERKRHMDRKHEPPRYQCRYWMAAAAVAGGRERLTGAGRCSSRWHADIGSRRRHETSVHGEPWDPNA